MKQGGYFGTEVDGKWWKRYKGRAFFARGNGEFWMDDDGIHFRKLLTERPLTIRWHEMTDADLSRTHAGRWATGRPILQVMFQRDGHDLVAGFLLSRNWDDMEELASDLRRKIAG